MCHAPRLSQADVARDLGIAVNSVRQWMTGICKPSPLIRERIKDKYGIPEALWDVEIPPGSGQTENKTPMAKAKIDALTGTLEEEQIMRLRSIGLVDEQIAEIVEIINEEAAKIAYDE